MLASKLPFFPSSDTWGRHCTKLFLVSHKLENSTLSIAKIKSTSAFQLLCESLHLINDDPTDFGWVLVATENTFVLLENFR